MRTTATTKPFIIGKFRKLVVSDIVIHSSILNDEMGTFIETESGQLQAEDGCFDDTVIASSMATVAVEKAALMMSPVAPLSQGIYEDPFMIENILKELTSRRSGFPIDARRYIDYENSIN